MSAFQFASRDLPPGAERLRAEVRAFLGEVLREFPPAKRAFTWSGSDPAFSRKVAERGWIGMTWPKRYGGHERSALERYVVLEEMLTAGAPVGAHWVGDRQSGPLLLRFGTEAQRARYLPPTCRGETFFCIGMSEPDSGSDLASIRARAVPVDGGWIVNGTKLWTSGASTADYMIALLRTAPETDVRHAGLSQFIVDLGGGGISVRTIRDLAGSEHFCEVVFEDAFVPADALIGEQDGGWSQVMAELAYERSGPERYLSCYPLLVELMRVLPTVPSERQAVEIGRQVAHLATLRAMSISVAGMLDDGENPSLEAALLKDIGCVFEQTLPGLAQSLVETGPRVDAGATDYQQVLAHFVQNAPAFSLRGGTREILRGIIARGLGLR